MTTTSAASIAATTCGVGDEIAREPDLANVGSLAEMDEVLLELEPALVGPDLGSDRAIGHRQDPCRDPERLLEGAHDLGQAASLADPCRPGDVRREISITQPEPVRLAVLGQAVHHGPGLVDVAPAALEVEPPGQHVHDRIVIGHHQQAVPLRVVAGVDDDRQVAGWQDGLEALGQLRAAGPAGQGDDPHATPLTPRGAPGPRPCARWSRGRTALPSGRSRSQSPARDTAVSRRPPRSVPRAGRCSIPSTRPRCGP